MFLLRHLEPIEYRDETRTLVTTMDCIHNIVATAGMTRARWPRTKVTGKRTMLVSTLWLDVQGLATQKSKS